MRRFWFAGGLLSLVSVLLTGPAAVASGFGEIEADLGYDDNVSNSASVDDPLSDGALLVDPSGGWRWQAGKNGRLSLVGSLESWFFADFDKLTHLDPALRFSWRQKTRVGSDSPWFELALSAVYQAFRSDIRTGIEAEFQFRFGHPVGPRYTYRLEATAYRRDADSEAFTQDAWWLTFHNDITLSESGLLYVQYRYRQGDITSSAVPQPILIAGATAINEDDAFPGRFAYRLDASTHALRLGWNQALGRKQSLDLRYEFRRSIADWNSELNYDNNTLRVSYLYAF